MNEIEQAREMQRVVDTLDRIDERTKRTDARVEKLQTEGLPACARESARIERIEKTLNGQLGGHREGWGTIKLGKFQASGQSVLVFGLVAIAFLWVTYRTESTAGSAKNTDERVQQVIGMLERVRK